MDPHAVPTFPCPRCGARFEGRPEFCPGCRTWLGKHWDGLRERVPWRYDLASLMIFIVVFAAGLALSLRRETVAIGLPILFLGPPTVIRAAPIFVARRRVGKPQSATVVIESVGIVAGLLLAAYFSFVGACSAALYLAFSRPAVFSIGAGSGLVAAVLVLYGLGRRIFPPRD
jgi:drug/metabolite transporter (DMT)-like permease